MKASDVYNGSDGELTKRYYAALEQRGPVGIACVNLFRAQKYSTRAKVYRGGVRGLGSFKRMAYKRKGWAIQNLCDVLTQHAAHLHISFGWKQDERESFASWIIYVDLPNGQVSFHSPSRYAGPDYPGKWDGQHLSCDRVLKFCDSVMEGKFTGITGSALSKGVQTRPAMPLLPVVGAAQCSPKASANTRRTDLPMRTDQIQGGLF